MEIGPCKWMGRVCGLFVLLFTWCTVFRRWTVLAQGQRQPCPCQEARCMVTLPGSPWQGWEGFSRCDQTACGSRRFGAGCLQGTASSVFMPRKPLHSKCHCIKGRRSPWSGCLSSPMSLVHPPLGLLCYGFGARSSSRMKRLFFPCPPPLQSLPPPQQCCGGRAETHSQQPAVTDGRS